MSYHQQLTALIEALGEMCELSGQAMGQATAALLGGNLFVAEKVLSARADILTLSAEAEKAAFVLLARQSPVAGELRSIVGAFGIIADVDRMSALSVHVAELARRRHPATVLPDDVAGYFEEMGSLAVRIAVDTAHAVTGTDRVAAQRLRHDDDAMDELHRHLFTVLIDQHWIHGVQTAVDVTLLSRYFERFADHAVLIGRRIATISPPRQRPL